MRKFDTNGLKLAEFQGLLFQESTTNFNCSSHIFLRRFLHSDLLKTLDKNESCFFSLDVNEGLDLIQRQFGKSSYGTIKYSKEMMFWLGYFLRYISYTRDVETNELLRLFDYKLVIRLYYVYHTQDMEWCVSSLLDIYGYNERIFDKNYILLQQLRKAHQIAK